MGAVESIMTSSTQGRPESKLAPHRYEVDRRVPESIQHGQVGVPAQAEDCIYTLHLQAARDELGSDQCPRLPSHANRAGNSPQKLKWLPQFLPPLSCSVDNAPGRPAVHGDCLASDGARTG
jgi:hypothetical protein